MGHTRKISDEQKALVLKRVAAGEKQTEIAKDLKVAPQSIYSIVKRAKDKGEMPNGIEGAANLAFPGIPDKAMKKELEFYKTRCIKLEAAVVDLELRLVEAKGLNFL
jgi:transposase